MPAPAAARPLRGEVWDVRFPAPVNEHPAVVLSANVLCHRLSSVTVVVVTGNSGPPSTHVPLDAEAGVDRYPASYANATDIHTVPLTRFRRKKGTLATREMNHLGQAVRAAFDLG